MEFSPKPGAVNPPSSPGKCNTDSDDVVVEDSRSMGDWDRDSVMGVNENDANQGDDESNSESDLWESITDSGPESVTGMIASCVQTLRMQQ